MTADRAASRPVVAVVGPTAVGKTDLGVALARQLDGEVVNADSMQLYRGMDVGTAKLTQAERAGVAHHLLDVWDVRAEASVAEYQRLARAAIADIRARGRRALAGRRVGALRPGRPGPDGVPRHRCRSCGPGWRPSSPRSAPARCTSGSPPLDPAAAIAILPSNGRRIVRALEVIEITGRPVHRVAAAGGVRGRRGPGRARPCRATSWTTGSSSGSTGCGPRAWSTRYAG